MVATLLSHVGIYIKTDNPGTVPFSKLEEAFGPDSLGIIVVRDLAPQFAELRRRLLSYSSHLASLPAEELCKFSHLLLSSPPSPVSK